MCYVYSVFVSYSMLYIVTCICVYVIGDIIATLSADTATQDNTTTGTHKEGHNSDPSSSLPIKALSTEAFESTMAFMLGFVKKDM